MSSYRALICGFLFAFAVLSLHRAGYSQSQNTVTGMVKDKDGGAIVGANVQLLNALQSEVRSTVTNSAGIFTLQQVPNGSYALQISTAQGFAPKRVAILVPALTAEALEIILGTNDLNEEVTVTAEIGTVQALDQTSQQVNVIDENKLSQRAKAVTAQIANDEPGLQLQRTSPSIGAVVVRGMTGAKVVNYVDGIRFSNAAARGGINSFFNLNDAANLRAVEVIRGPNSAQFGSDSIGGSVQLVSRTPTFTRDGTAVHGQFSSHYNSADHSFGGSQLVSIGRRNLALLVNLSGHRSNTIRPGGGYESHSAVQRFLGLRSNILLGERSTDTAFTQYGGMFRVSYRPSERDQLTFHYQRGQIDGGKRFDQTIGGDGNLIADLRNFMLDFFYARYERFQAGWFDTVTLSTSYNAQREARVNQGGNGNPLGTISHQPERVVVRGIQSQATKQWALNTLVIGGELYRDLVRSPSFVVDPISNIATSARPRVPDQSTYYNVGFFIQNAWNAIPERLRLVGAVRYGHTAYRSLAANSPLVNGRALWPDDRVRTNTLTPRFGVTFMLREGISISGQLSRGFRAPHITDLGTLGLTGNGFEANAVDLVGRGATIGSTANSDAVSTGIPVAQLRPETSWSYEAGFHFHRRRLDFDVNAFVNDVYDNIVLQALILPSGAVGLQLGDQRVTAQNASGAVFVAAATNPVLIRANYGDARIFGIEQKFEAKLTARLVLGQNFTYLHAADRITGAPPTIEGGSPAPQGNLRLRYSLSNDRFWFEPYVYAARRQTRLSTLDLEDRRSGATRSRASIQNFFRRGATARGFVGGGADGRIGTADDILLATGETLPQLQQRILGNANSAPLFPAIPGFVTFGVRGGVRLNERNQLFWDVENLNDKNYRGISWGLDAPGRSFAVRFRTSF